MPNVTKAPLNTEFAKKTCKEYKEGTSAGVTITPRRQIEPKIAEHLANRLTFGFSLEKKFAAFTRYTSTANN